MGLTAVMWLFKTNNIFLFYNENSEIDGSFHPFLVLGVVEL